MIERGEMRRRVVTVGDANPDIIFTGLTNLPIAEQDTLAAGLQIVLGGQTATISRSLARLGVDVVFIGRVGNDYYGRWAVEQLRMDGVDTSAMVLDSGLKTGATVVLSTGAERAFVTYMGSISEVRRSDISPEMLAMASHLHIGSYFLQRRLHPDMVELLQEAKGLGLTTSVDPGWDNFREWNGGIIEALPFVDVFLPNLVEAMQITKADSGEGALKVLAKHGNLVVIKMGSEGCLVCQRDTRFHLPAFKVPVVDVTSAGDVFNAGFLYGFLMDWELEHTARFANGCGAIAVSQVGSAGMISGVSQVQEFLAGRARDSRVQ